MDGEQIIDGAGNVADNADPSLATPTDERQLPEAADDGATPEAEVTEPSAPQVPGWREALDSMPHSLPDDALAELERHPLIHGLVRREQQSALRQQQGEQQRANEQRLAQLADVDDYVDRTLVWLQKAHDEGQDVLITRGIHKRGVRDFALGIEIRNTNELLQDLAQLAPPEGRVSEETARAVQETRQKAEQRQGAGPRDLLRATFDAVVEAKVNAEREKAEATWRRDWQKKNAAEAKAAQMKANEEQRQGITGPTNINGAAGPRGPMDATAYSKWLETNPTAEEIDAQTAHYLRGT